MLDLNPCYDVMQDHDASVLGIVSAYRFQEKYTVTFISTMLSLNLENATASTTFVPSSLHSIRE